MAKRTQGHRLKERVTGSVQFVIGEDDDLIRWWRSYENGDRQSSVKRLLRDALKYPQPTARPSFLTTDKFEEWVAYYDAKIEGLEVRPTTKVTPATVQRIVGDDDVGEDELRLREARMRKQQW